MKSGLLLYLFEATCCLTLCALFFKLVLAKLTFFGWNRIFLCAASLVSIIFPYMSIPYPHIPSLPHNEIAQSSLPHVPVSITHSYMVPTLNLLYWLESIVIYVYLIGVLILLLRFALQLLAVFRLIASQAVIKEKGYYLLKNKRHFPTCSFFNYIIVNTDRLDETEIAQVIAHEKVHAQQWHSLDLLALQLLCSIFWFNPLMWWLKKQAQLNHEYLADAAAHRFTTPLAYAQLMVKLASEDSLCPLLHNFSNVQLKNRIIMLHHTQTASAKKLRFLLSLPLLAVMLWLVSCEQPIEAIEPDQSALVGTWINIDRTTVNHNDGHTPRLFPERTGGIVALTEELTLHANGTFTMYEKENTHPIAGTWRASENKLILPQLWISNDAVSASYAGKSLTLRFQNAHLGLQTIQIQCISLSDQKLEAYQPYVKEGGLSGGSIYYGYIKQ